MGVYALLSVVRFFVKKQIQNPNHGISGYTIIYNQRGPPNQRLDIFLIWDTIHTCRWRCYDYNRFFLTEFKALSLCFLCLEGERRNEAEKLSLEQRC